MTVLVSFWLDRCRDVPCLPEALDGLLALAQHQPLGAAADTIAHGCEAWRLSHSHRSHSAPNVPPPSYSRMACVPRSVFDAVPVNTFAQPVRLAVYRLLSALVERHAPALLPRGAELAFGLTRSVDSEKDPRNLLVAFRLIRAVAQLVPLSDELAEVRLHVRNARTRKTCCLSLGVGHGTPCPRRPAGSL